jgi:hypothetical protein
MRKKSYIMVDRGSDVHLKASWMSFESHQAPPTPWNFILARDDKNRPKFAVR